MQPVLLRLESILRAAISVGLLAGSGVWAPARAAQAEPPEQYAELNEEQVEETDRFAINNAIATVFHEAGHMLVSEFNLPVLGREEDAVDGLSTLFLLEAEEEDFNVAVEDWANVWFLTAAASEDEEPEDDSSFWDEHGLDQQRAYATICWMVGKNAKRFGEFADSVEYPEDRREQCLGEYEQLRTSWNAVLAPHEAHKGDETKFKVTYKETDNPQLNYFRDMLMQENVMEMVVHTFSGSYRLKDGIKLTAEECGVANAYWNGEGREMTLCYEDVLNSAELNAQWYIDNPDE